ncbi:MAG TPA: ATP-binding protein [Nevskiaceae bacterium]|nr:ATP-binding protein [Nevskiaceae bacterium]
MDLLSDFLTGGRYLPHGVCFLRDSNLLWLHVTSNAVIALAYYMIPVALVFFLRGLRMRISFQWAIGLFAAFIVLCGTGHIVDIITLWQPVYWLQGTLRAVTAVVSIATAICIIPLVPRLLQMRSPEELEQANRRLREEIRKREQAEADLRRSLEELKRAVQELEQFAYITSHDLQAPLRNVSGFSQLLLRRYRDKLGGDAAEFLGFIDQGVRHMQALINDLLALSRVGRNQSQFEKRPLREAVDRALQVLAPAIDAAQARVEIGELPVVEAEHNLLTQLFQNLVGNALKFQTPGEQPRISIDATETADHWLIRVRDNGIGIPQDQLKSIFAVFRRLHAADAYEGTGIGLSICQRIAQHHGGEIWAESDPVEGGSRFCLRLPKQLAASLRGRVPLLGASVTTGEAAPA